MRGQVEQKLKGRRRALEPFRLQRSADGGGRVCSDARRNSGSKLTDGHFSSETVMRSPSAPSSEVAVAVAVQSVITRDVSVVA